MRKKLFSTLSVVLIVFLMVASCAWQLQTLYDNGVTDEEYVSVAREHPDAQAFLENIPKPRLMWTEAVGLRLTS